MDVDKFRLRWQEIRSDFKEYWITLTGDEIDWINGYKDRLVGLAQQEYGRTREQAEEEVDLFLFLKRLDNQACTRRIADFADRSNLGGKPIMATKQLAFQVQGMTCTSCVSRIERALNKVDGVLAAQVNLATEMATVEYASNGATLDDFRQAVAHAGYKVLEVPEQIRTEGEQEIDQQVLKLATDRFPVRAAWGMTSEEDLNRILANLFVVGFCLFVWVVWIVALLNIV